jgi:ATP-dependent Clp protease ATP-binding subunit ClpX
MSEKVQCSFCSKKIDKKKVASEEELVFLGTDPSTVICEKCVKACLELMNDSSKKNEAVKQDLNEVTPKKIKSQLDEWIIGQEDAKKTLAIALYNHYKRLNQSEEDLMIEKSNVLLVGSTGSGKTASVKALSKAMDLPLVIEDVTSISSTGYVGRDTEDILKNLLAAADNDLEKAQKGIVLLDEGDKLKREKNGNGARDVKGEGVQQSLLKIVEGGVFDIKTKTGTIKFDTTNVLFILSGAFEGIEKVIEKRLKSNDKSSSVGFTGKVDTRKDSQKYNELIIQVKHEDLKNFGMMPELLGRFPIVTALQELSEEALVEILTKPNNAIIKQFQKSFEMDNVELSFSEEALFKIAKEAKTRKIGARALRSIVEDILKEPMFEAPGEKTISAIVVDKNLKVNYISNTTEEELEIQE